MISRQQESDLHDYVIALTVFGIGVACGILVAFTQFWPDRQPSDNSDTIRPDNTRPAVSPLSPVSDQIQSLGHGVHVFPADDFPRRLADFIDTNGQTIVVAVCPLQGDKSPGYLVLTRPDPEWLKILPGSAQPPNPGG